MTYAPIIIPTLNRIEHLTRCIESLRKNRLADKTDLYIALDYPPSQKYEEGYEKVKAYLENGIKPNTMVRLFSQLDSLTEIEGLGNINTSNVRDMTEVFTLRMIMSLLPAFWNI